MTPTAMKTVFVCTGVFFFMIYGAGFICQVYPLILTAIRRGYPSDSEPKILADKLIEGEFPQIPV